MDREFVAVLHGKRFVTILEIPHRKPVARFQIEADDAHEHGGYYWTGNRWMRRPSMDRWESFENVYNLQKNSDFVRREVRKLLGMPEKRW